MNYVSYLLSKGKDIYEQINILKENSDNKEVKLYISELKKEEHFSPNMKNILDKYLFDKKVKEDIIDTDLKLFPIFINGYDNKTTIERVIHSGDYITIMNGNYKGITAKVLYIENDKAIVLIDLFGKEVVEDILIDDIGGKLYES